MSKGDTFENDLLKLIFNNTTLPLIGDATGLVGSTGVGSLYVSLHTGVVGEADAQNVNEATYTGYARKDVTRTAGGWVVTGSTVNPAATITFNSATAGTNTISHFAIGTSISGATKVLYKGSLSSSIVVTPNVTPQLTTATAITED